MNYQHAFHAGNFADVFKHLLLSRMLLYLARKPAPFRFIDTHAGLGRYDLAGPEAARTGEWESGIARLLGARIPAELDSILAPYRAAVGPCDDAGRPLSYPGSPAVAQHCLRPQDRMLLAELHPKAATTLRRTMAGDKRMKVLERDGYAALAAVLPPPERRGLVLIDPPFEARDEFDRIAEALAVACRKWATGIYAVWYPIKEARPVTIFQRHLSQLGLAPLVKVELQRAQPVAGAALRGCGLVVLNPPYGFADEARLILPFLGSVLAPPNEPKFEWIVDESELTIGR